MPFDDEKPELNITPLVDIMLVLLANLGKQHKMQSINYLHYQ